MSNVDDLDLLIYLKLAEESLNERLDRIKAEAKVPDSKDEATVAAVERMLASKREEDADIEDDFAGGTSGIDGSPWLMTWRSHLAEFILRLKEVGYEKYAGHFARLAAVNSQKKPFTADDEANVIKSILKDLEAFKKEVSGDEESANNTTPKGRGRPKADDKTVQHEAQLAADWERARDAGTYKVDFARDKGMKVADLDKLLDRVAKRKKTSE